MPQSQILDPKTMNPVRLQATVPLGSVVLVTALSVGEQKAWLQQLWTMVSCSLPEHRHQMLRKLGGAWRGSPLVLRHIWEPQQQNCLRPSQPGTQFRVLSARATRRLHNTNRAAHGQTPTQLDPYPSQPAR